MNRILLVVTAIVFTCCQSCENTNLLGGYDDRLVIVNNTDRYLYMNEQINHPDTSISSYNPSVSPETCGVPPNAKTKMVSSSWPQMVTMSPSDTLMIFLFDGEVLKNTPWETVRENYMILKRYDLSIEDLEGMNWTITYP